MINFMLIVSMTFLIVDLKSLLNLDAATRRCWERGFFVFRCKHFTGCEQKKNISNIMIIYKLIKLRIWCSLGGNDEGGWGQWPWSTSVDPCISCCRNMVHIFVSQTASGMSGIQMEIKESCDCYAVHIEDKPIGKYPWTCFGVGCNHKA